MPVSEAHRVAMQAWYEYVSSNNIKTVGGAEVVLCPFCTNVHLMCRFAAGSLECVNNPCHNPHCLRPPF